MNALFSIIQPWLLRADSDDLMALHKHLIWLQKELFNEYEPHLFESFDDRLADWLQNVPDGDDRRWLFRLLSHFFFIGKQQFDSLCRASFNDDITRWLIDKSGIDIVSGSVEKDIRASINETWFCPLTDSMRINSFLKLNSLKGHDCRPDWYSLEIFGDPAKIQEYVSRLSIKNLVLLEDFVGSGNQMKNTVIWAAQTLPSTNILLVPLVCCPDGVKTGQSIAKAYANVDFAPTLSLRTELFLLDTPAHNEPREFAEVRKIILQLQARFGDYAKLPFGYEWTGALVAMYSNCPDNTLPLIHHRTDQWSPLFARVQRS